MFPAFLTDPKLYWQLPASLNTYKMADEFEQEVYERNEVLNLPYLGLLRSHGHWIAVQYFYLSIPHGLLSSITVLCIPVRSTTLL